MTSQPLPQLEPNGHCRCHHTVAPTAMRPTPTIDVVAQSNDHCGSGVTSARNLYFHPRARKYNPDFQIYCFCSILFPNRGFFPGKSFHALINSLFPLIRCFGTYDFIFWGGLGLGGDGEGVLVKGRPLLRLLTRYRRGDLNKIRHVNWFPRQRPSNSYFAIGYTRSRVDVMVRLRSIKFD